MPQWGGLGCTPGQESFGCCFITVSVCGKIIMPILARSDFLAWWFSESYSLTTLMPLSSSFGVAK
jgi:hypothetical protein